jgi:hypothetical protein
MNRRDYIKQSAMALGLTISAGSISQLLSACSKSTIDWKPSFMSAKEANLVSLISDTLLPKTATPGAVELGVPQFIDRLIPVSTDEDGQAEFKKGIAEFEENCKEQYQKSFENLIPEERAEFLVAQDQDSASFPISMWGIMLDPNPAPITFYRNLKSLILMGYFSSEKIGEEVLVYAPIPGPYQGCISYEGQNAWSE